ncbi:MAG TPA: peptidoglycan DD-metalloendopeptidase family protein, partial [Motiliproteus sp.]
MTKQKLVTHISKVPRAHLIAMSLCVALLGIALLLPSEDVAANRTQIELIAPLANPSLSEPAQSGLISNPPTSDNDSPSLITTTAPKESVSATASPENWLTITVRSGDNLTTLFNKAGLGPNEMYPLLNGIKPSKALTRLVPGEQLEFLIERGNLLKLRHVTSPLTHTLISQREDAWSLDEIALQPDITYAYKGGTIEQSLFVAGEKAGLSQKKIMELAAIFGWDVDFALDIRQGDSFAVLYEEQWLNDEKIGDGEIVAAEFTNQGNTFQAIRFTDSKGRADYFTPSGDTLRKAFLRTPVDFARISSGFNPNRKHPIFKTSRPHRGVDYAAPTGTPIKASGDGKLTFVGSKGGYGKVVIVQHGESYSTLYAHMSRIKPGMKRGKRVQQGDVIGYVGRTGYATGP